MSDRITKTEDEEEELIYRVAIITQQSMAKVSDDLESASAKAERAKFSKEMERALRFAGRKHMAQMRHIVENSTRKMK